MMGQAFSDDAPSGVTRSPSKWRPGLSSRALVLTIFFVLLAEILIFFPSIANYYVTWLRERVDMAQTAVIAIEIEKRTDRRVTDELSRQLLENAQINVLAISSDQGRELILSPAMPVSGEMDFYDLRESQIIPPIFQTLSLMANENIMYTRVVDDPKFEANFIEVILDASQLREDLIDYCHNIFWLSIFISIFAGVLIYLSLVFLVVRPIGRLTRAIEYLRDDPRDLATRTMPSGRMDEIGRAETTLADMEVRLKAAFRERERLAQLGEAIAKINHDLRNSLTSAQLVSDSLSRSEDPRVKRAAPRLERAIERAITLTEDTLKFGRSDPPQPNLASCVLHEIVDEAAFEALAGIEGIIFVNELDKTLTARIDPDHMHRIIVNLVRNAAQAITQSASQEGTGRISIRQDQDGMDVLKLQIVDNGPGIPERVQETLFKPFSASTSSKGSGLGLANAYELARGLSGDLILLQTGAEGTAFELTLQT